jgi:hypothetical protein
VAAQAQIHIEIAVTKLPQTGGALLNKLILDLLWHGLWSGPGIPVAWCLGSHRTCKYPMSGRGLAMHVCGHRSIPDSSYCLAHHRMCYYRPQRKLQNPSDRVQSIAPAKPGSTDHRVLDLLGEMVE